jgi:DTW domain-containing protein YfiP
MFGPLFEDACNDTQGTWILFPSPDAVDICDIVANNLKETNNPLQGPYPMRNLIVIDGTWHTAKRILSKNANILSQMRPVCIKPTKAGNYRIRGEPNSQCLSTIEATACCISTIEGDESVYDKMMMPLNGLVESHQERMALVNKN